MKRYVPRIVTEKELEYENNLFENLTTELEIFTHNYIVSTQYKDTPEYKKGDVDLPDVINVSLDNRFTFFEFIITFPKSILLKDFDVHDFFLYCEKEISRNWNYIFEKVEDVPKYYVILWKSVV